MFTGIIEDLGFIAALRKLEGRQTFVVGCGFDPGDIREGDSIAVNGVCLTVVGLEGAFFQADASLETLRLTTLGDLSINDRVNLERAMRLDSRLGGHIVTGHADGTGRIVGLGLEGDSIRIEVEAPPEISRYIVRKGSVALDGISLTVNEQRDNRFMVNVIPYTAAKTTIGSKSVGDRVNIETDMLGRYVEKFAAPGKNEGLDLDFLYRYGYIKGR